ncbi:tetratricopeptide repeat protein [Pedobacter sp. Leaf176]|uniref:tetratricopeptide repeat protein n=1 Tax=Pedobacter sp. Leaf176 TaxID=1736286 RepID=UPI000A467DA4|nr:tetratricopeptide repeat protein [Pedobacter sp. Leaf176]
MNFLLILLIGAMLCRISFMVIIVLHELGHAVTGMLFSKAGATIYLGSYGDAPASYKYSIGKLTLYILKNPFKWIGGMCLLDNQLISLNKKIIQLLAGPVMPLIVAAITFTSALYFDWHGSVKLGIAILLGVAIYSMLQSLIPTSKQIQTSQGKPINNDGKQIKNLLKLKQVEPVVNRALKLFDEGHYAEAGPLFYEKVLKVVRQPEIFKLATLAYLHAKNYERAREVTMEHLKEGEFDTDDFSNAALACSHLEQNELAIEYYNLSLALDPTHKYSLNNLGFTLNNIEQYENAIELFDRAVLVDPSFAYSYNNRGFAKMMLGDLEDGLADIEKSFKLDPENAYAYRNLGIYQLKQNNDKKALELFEKAKLIDPSTHKIDYYIDIARK